LTVKRVFRIRRDVAYRPLLLLFGATRPRSYLELREDAIHARFSWYRVTIPLDHIQRAKRARWAWYAGIGWRSNMTSILGLIGSYQGVVHLKIAPPVRTRVLLIPIRLRDFYISLEDPDGFLAVLAERRPDTVGSGEGGEPAR